MNTPPLNSTCVGRTGLPGSSPWACRKAARCRVTAVSDSNGRPISRKPDARCRAGRSVGWQCGKKPSTSSSLTSRRSTSTETVPPISLRPRPRTEIACVSGPSGRQQRFLGRAAGMPQGDRLPGVELHALFGEPAGDVMGQGQVHVVAAHQQVIADGDPPQDQFALLLGGADQRQVGRAAADVADQQRVADAKAPAASARRWRPARRRRPPAALPAAPGRPAARRPARPRASARRRWRRTRPAR